MIFKKVLISMISRRHKPLEWDNLGQLEAIIHRPGTEVERNFPGKAAVFTWWSARRTDLSMHMQETVTAEMPISLLVARMVTAQLLCGSFRCRSSL